MEKIKICAKKIVQDVCKIKGGERVLIVTNRVFKDSVADTDEISKALHEECENAGAKVVTIVQPVKASLDNAEPEVIAALKTEPDVLFSISENKLGKDCLGLQTPYIAEDGSS